MHNEFHRALRKAIEDEPNQELRQQLALFLKDVEEEIDKDESIYDSYDSIFSNCRITILPTLEERQEKYTARHVIQARAYLWLEEFLEEHPRRDDSIDTVTIIADEPQGYLIASSIVDEADAANSIPPYSSPLTITIDEDALSTQTGPFQHLRNEKRDHLDVRPFQHSCRLPPNIFQKIIGWSPKLNFLVELNNLILDSDPLDAFDLRAVDALREKYRLPTTMRRNSRIWQPLIDLYASYFTYFLSKAIDEQRSTIDDDLTGCDFSAVVRVMNDNVPQNYGETVDRIFIAAGLRLEDMAEWRAERVRNELQRLLSGCFCYTEFADGNRSLRLRCDDDWHSFREIGAIVGSDERIAREVHEQFATPYLANLIAMFIDDGEFGPDRKEMIRKAQRDLGVRLRVDSSVEGKLYLGRQRWSLKNEPLPQHMSHAFNLQKGEHVHLSYALSEIQWCEEKRISKRTKHGGAGYSVGIGGGIRVFSGGGNSTIEYSEELTAIDAGELAVTNKRLIFVGEKRGRNIKYSNILRITPCANGLEIFRDNGKNIFLQMHDFHRDTCVIILKRLGVLGS